MSFAEAEAKQTNDSKLKDLCLSLMKADSEEDVIDILTKAGYWNNTDVWRFYGDNENNFSTIGNQQSKPEAALVEKLVNSVDARLINECLIKGVDPEGPDAPQTIREAVSSFFENSENQRSDLAGLVREWADKKRTEVARGIAFFATGAKAKEGNPCSIKAACPDHQSSGSICVPLLPRSYRLERRPLPQFFLCRLSGARCRFHDMTIWDKCWFQNRRRT